MKDNWLNRKYMGLWRRVIIMSMIVVALPDRVMKNAGLVGPKRPREPKDHKTEVRRNHSLKSHFSSTTLSYS